MEVDSDQHPLHGVISVVAKHTLFVFIMLQLFQKEVHKLSICTRLISFLNKETSLSCPIFALFDFYKFKIMALSDEGIRLYPRR